MCNHDGFNEECTARCRCDCMECMFGANDG
jgi:hypothetical protein